MDCRERSIGFSSEERIYCVSQSIPSSFHILFDASFKSVGQNFSILLQFGMTLRSHFIATCPFPFVVFVKSTLQLLEFIMQLKSETIIVILLPLKNTGL